MKRLLILLLLGLAGCRSAHHPNDELRLWYDRPAERWEEALPLGNGRLGAMPHGGILTERITLNEESMWYGSPQNVDNPEAAEWLPGIRALLLEGRNAEAQEMMYSHFVCRGRASVDPAYGSYTTLGELRLRMEGLDSTAVSHYRRELSLRDAVATTSFRVGEACYTRQYFTSMADNALVIRLKVDGGEPLSLWVELEREEALTTAAEGLLRMEGRLASGSERYAGVGYLARAEVVSDGRVEAHAGALHITDAHEVEIRFAAATDYGGRSPQEQVDEALTAVSGHSFEELRAEHVAMQRELFDRVVVELGEHPHDLTTDRRIEQFARGDDNALAALYMQYGRYLLIASTHRAMLPPNLQGVWANQRICPWNGDYHLNINIQMNHWPLEVGHLPELIEPLTRYTEQLAESGAHTAQLFYRSPGWCAHVLANAWGFTAPAEDPSWGATNTGGAWLSLHLWEHYRYTQDEAYLQRIYPLLKGASEFLYHNLMEEPSHGWLVTAPTTSPENGYYLPDNPEQILYVCMGSTMDTQIARELFGAVISASELLHRDEAYAAALAEALKRLPPHQISREGYLQEWLEDYREMDVRHRHVSHLFGLYPGSQISRCDTLLADACRMTLERRGDGGTGWSRAWKIAFRARLGDGDRALKLLGSLLQPAITPEGDRGGTFPNLFCSHPPFQIDGNFGGAAGIMEMLLQSHDGVIDLLPALPEAWSSGSYRGLMARGGVEVGCRWHRGRVVEATLRSATTQRLTVRTPDGELRAVECPARKVIKVAF